MLPTRLLAAKKSLDAGPKNVLSLQPKGTGRKIDFTICYALNRQSTCEIGNESPPTRTCSGTWLWSNMVAVESAMRLCAEGFHRASGQLGNLARREVGCGLPSPLRPAHEVVPCFEPWQLEYSNPTTVRNSPDGWRRNGCSPHRFDMSALSP